MSLYEITYVVAGDPGSPRMTQTKEVPDRQYLDDWIDDTWNHDEWEILSICRKRPTTEPPNWS